MEHATNQSDKIKGDRPVGLVQQYLLECPAPQSMEGNFVQTFVTYTNNDGPGVNDGSLSDVDTSENGTVCTDMDVVADVDICCDSDTAATFRRLRVDGRFLRVNGDVCTNTGVPSDGDPPRIKEGTICSNVHVVSDGNVISIIAREGSIDIDLAAKVTPDDLIRRAIRVSPSCLKNRTENAITRLSGGLLLAVVGLIEMVNGLSALFPILDELWAEGLKRFPIQHLVFLRSLQSRRWGRIVGRRRSWRPRRWRSHRGLMWLLGLVV